MGIASHLGTIQKVTEKGSLVNNRQKIEGKEDEEKSG